MATNITTSYAGDAAEGYVAPAILGATTLGTPTITIHESIEGKQVVRNLDASGAVFADATCDFTSAGDINYSEVVLDLKGVQMNLEDCKLNWKKTWEQANRRAKLLDQAPPADMATWMLDRLAKQAASKNELLVWQGDAVNAGEYNGLLKAISAAKTATPDVTGAAITSSTVIAALEAMLGGVSDAVYSTWMQEEGFKLYVPMAVDKAYQLALGTNAGGSYNDGVTVGRKPMDFNGIPLVPTPGLLGTTMIGAKSGDLHFGTNLLSDENEVKLIDMAMNDGSNNFRYVLQFEGDSNITNAADITWGVFS